MRPPAGARRPEDDERAFEAWVAQTTERFDPLMAWLGVVFALLVGYEIAVPLSDDASRTLLIAGWLLWAVFALEFGAKLWLAPHKRRFVRRHWLQALMLLVPWLRFLRFIRLVRLGRALPAARVISSSYRTLGTARRLLGSRLGYLGAMTVVAAIALAELAYVFERDHPQPVFASFGDSVLWAAGVVLALHGDPVPNSLGAHLAMLAGFAFGLVVVASLAGTVGAFFVDQRREQADAEGESPVPSPSGPTGV